MKTTNFLYETFCILICSFCSQLIYGIDNGTRDTTKVLYDSLNRNKKSVCKLNPIVDVPIVAIGGGWSGYLLVDKLYKKSPSTQEQILSLTSANINAFDRRWVYPYNATLDKNSYYPFYGCLALPVILPLTGNDMRNDYFKLCFLYLETLSVTGIFGTTSTYLVDRYRPYVYDANTPIDTKLSPNAKNSFYAGHVEIVAVSTFFISEVYAGYYPESKMKWVFFTMAGLATAGMGCVRIAAGMHFPSDVLLGAATGTLSGIFVPYFHKHKVIKDPAFSFNLYEANNTYGASLVYKF